MMSVNPVNILACAGQEDAKETEQGTIIAGLTNPFLALALI